MISVDEALAKVLALAGAPSGEVVALDTAAGRILLDPAISRMTQPPFNSAAMDGYAYRLADQAKSLRVIGESAAGHPWSGDILPETAIRIFTGAPVPDGYDRVEMQENTVSNGDFLTITTPSDNSHIRPRGSDFAKGDRLEPGQLLTPAKIGLLAAMNVSKVTVARRPKVAVLAGGDELIRPGDTPQDGQIISSNDLAVAALVQETGAEVEILPIARDSEASLQESFAQAEAADLLVTIGGASVGDHDLIGKTAAGLGMDRAFYKVAMRPGKPLMAGRIGNCVMLGLPGNPVSAIVCAKLFMQPLLRQMQGLREVQHRFRARLGVDMNAEGGRQHYLRAELKTGTDLPCIKPFKNQDSSLLSVLSQANALLIRPANDPARRAGELVEYMPL